jgi:hypothetical protein
MGAEAVWTSELGFYDERSSNVRVQKEKAQNFFKHDLTFCILCMERHYVHEANKGLAYILIIIGVSLACVALGLLIKSMITGPENEALEWTNIFYLIQGASLVFLGLYHLRKRKYYIEWNREEIKIYLPGYKEIDMVQISDIKGLEIKLFEVLIHMEKGDKRIDLEHVEFESIRSIKDKFEEISSMLP